MIADRRTTAHLVWAALFLIALTFSIVSLASPSNQAVAQPTERHPTLQFDGYGIAAHRGASATAPENTLAAVRGALDVGVDFIEVDLRLTADGVPVLFHDRTVNRTTGGSGELEALTLRDLRALEAGSWVHDEFHGERIPTLHEFVELLSSTDQAVLLELKGTWSVEQVTSVVDLIDDHGMTDRTAVLSFSADSIRAVHAVQTELATVWLVRKFDDTTIHRVIELGANGVGARLLMYERYPNMTKQLASIGAVSLSYTLNDPGSWARASLLGVDIVATDHAESLLRWADR